MVKKLLIVFSLLIISTGFIISHNSSGSPSSENVYDTPGVKIYDTTVAVSETYAKAMEESDTREKHETEEVSKSNILPDSGKNGDFTSMSLVCGLLGMFVLSTLAWLFSTNRKAIGWSLVGEGLLILIGLAPNKRDFSPEMG